MPFPPTFDRAWDETFPPDTQLANLLGQDIRNFKTDIRERLSLIGGTFTNRPANMDAIYGGSGFGILYFATDTNQIFQWNGSAWITVSLFHAEVINNTLSTTGASTSLLMPVPASSFNVGDVVEIISTIRQTAGGAVAVSMTFGGGDPDPGISSSGTGWKAVYRKYVAITAAAAQLIDSEQQVNGVSPVISNFAGTTNTGVGFNIAINIALSTATFVIDSFFARTNR